MEKATKRTVSQLLTSSRHVRMRRIEKVRNWDISDSASHSVHYDAERTGCFLTGGRRELHVEFC